LSVDKVWPSTSVPEIVGACVLLGADVGWTVAVGADVAGLLVPPALLAVSCTSIV
jgi:hypothetical protein